MFITEFRFTLDSRTINGNVTEYLETYLPEHHELWKSNYNNRQEHLRELYHDLVDKLMLRFEFFGGMDYDGEALAHHLEVS
jgi:hypothetical protein